MPKPRSDYKARRSGRLRNRSDHLGFFNIFLNFSARFLYLFTYFHFAPIEKRLPWLGFDPMTSRSAAKHHTHWANTAGLFLCVLAFVSCVFFFFQFRCNCFAVYSLSDTRFKKASHFFFFFFFVFLAKRFALYLFPGRHSHHKNECYLAPSRFFTLWRRTWRLLFP